MAARGILALAFCCLPCVHSHLTAVCSSISPTIPDRLVFWLVTYYHSRSHANTPGGATLEDPAGNLRYYSFDDNPDYCQIPSRMYGPTSGTIHYQTQIQRHCTHKSFRGRRLVDSNSVFTCYGQNPNPIVPGKNWALGLADVTSPAFYSTGGWRWAVWAQYFYALPVDNVITGHYSLATWHTDDRLDPCNGVYHLPCFLGQDKSSRRRRRGSAPRNGTWWFELGKPTGAAPCASPPPAVLVNNTSFSSYHASLCSNQPDGFICPVYCAPGYKQVGHLECSDGAWTSDFSCSPNSCQMPTATNNAGINGAFGYPVGIEPNRSSPVCGMLSDNGAACEFTCSAENSWGYGRLVCNSGTWVKETPEADCFGVGTDTTWPAPEVQQVGAGIGSGDMQVFWTQPDDGARRSRVLKYGFDVIPAGSLVCPEYVGQMPSPTGVRCFGGNPSNIYAYQVRVRALNTAGWGAWSLLFKSRCDALAPDPEDVARFDVSACGNVFRGGDCQVGCAPGYLTDGDDFENFTCPTTLAERELEGSYPDCRRPARAPAQVAVSSVDPTISSLHISWENTGLGDVGGAIPFAGWHLELRPAGGSWQVPAGCTSLTGLWDVSCVATGLASYTLYEARVTAQSSRPAFSSPTSLIGEGRTEPVRVDPPVNVVVSNATVSTLSVSWDPAPAQNDCVFRKWLVLVQAPSGAWTRHPPGCQNLNQFASRSCVIENLACDRTFQIRIRQLCTVRDANSWRSLGATGSTPREGACSIPATPPVDLQISALSPSSARFSWVAGIPNDCAFQTWSVRAQRLRNGVVAEFEAVAGCTSLTSRLVTECTATHLWRGSYRFDVEEICANSVANSAPSVASAYVELPLAPAHAPTDVRLADPTLDSMQVSWSGEDLRHCTFKRWQVTLWEPDVNTVQACEMTVNPTEDHRHYSSVWNNDAIGTRHARSMLDSLQAWSARYNRADEYMGMDLGRVEQVRGLITQGRRGGGQWVTKYKVKYSLDGVTWSEVPGEFVGNTDDTGGKVTNRFAVVLQAQYLRIIPITWRVHISMRAAAIVACHATIQPVAQVPCTGITLGEHFVQIGNFRLADLFGHHFSIASSSQTKTVVIYRNDGTTHPGPRDDWQAFDRSDNTNGISFGDRFIQIRNWRFSDVDGTHFSIAHIDGYVSRIWRSDGRDFAGPRRDYSALDRQPGPPIDVHFGDRFIQIGQWRIGDHDSRHLSIQHQNGKTAMIFREDGTNHYGRGNRNDFGTWDRSLPTPECSVQGFRRGQADPSGCAGLVTACSTDCRITGLTSNTGYEADVRALCEEPSATSPYSALSPLLTTLPQPANAPPTILMAGITDTSVVLSWTSGTLSPDCAFTAWEVQAMEVGQTIWNEPTGCDDLATRSSPTCTATGLRCGTSYLVRVREVCQIVGANSDWTVSSAFTTLSTGACLIPASPPEYFRLVPRSATTVEVSFATGSPGDCTFAGFVVQAQRSGDATWSSAGSACSLMQPRESTVCLATGLNEDTEYRFRAREVCSNDATLNSIYGISDTVRTLSVPPLALDWKIPEGVLMETRPSVFTAILSHNAEIDTDAIAGGAALTICPSTYDPEPNSCGCTGSACESNCLIAETVAGSAQPHVYLPTPRMLWYHFGTVFTPATRCAYTVTVGQGLLRTEARPAKSSAEFSWTFTYSPPAPELELMLVSAASSSLTLKATWSTPTDFTCSIEALPERNFTGVYTGQPVQFVIGGLVPSTPYRVVCEGRPIHDPWNIATETHGPFRTADDLNVLLSSLGVTFQIECDDTAIGQPMVARLVPPFDPTQAGGTYKAVLEVSDYREECNISDSNDTGAAYTATVAATAQSPFATVVTQPMTGQTDLSLDWPAGATPYGNVTQDITVTVTPGTAGNPSATYTAKVSLVFANLRVVDVRGAAELFLNGTSVVDIDVTMETIVDPSSVVVVLGSFVQTTQVQNVQSVTVDGRQKTLATLRVPGATGNGQNLPVAAESDGVKYTSTFNVSFEVPPVLDPNGKPACPFPDAVNNAGISGPNGYPSAIRIISTMPACKDTHSDSGAECLFTCSETGSWGFGKLVCDHGIWRKQSSTADCRSASSDSFWPAPRILSLADEGDGNLRVFFERTDDGQQRSAPSLFDFDVRPGGELVCLPSPGELPPAGGWLCSGGEASDMGRYQVRVRATNLFGPGPWSDAAQRTCQPLVPPTADAWRYDVSACQHLLDSRSCRPTCAAGTVLSGALQDFVCASPGSPTGTYPLCLQPAEPPVHVSVVGHSSSSANIAWDDAGLNDCGTLVPFVRWRVQVKTNVGPGAGVWSEPAGCLDLRSPCLTACKATTLLSNSNYEAKVSAVCGQVEANSPESVPGSGYTLPSAAEPPVNLQLTSATATTIGISWQPGQQGDCAFERWELEVRGPSGTWSSNPDGCELLSNLNSASCTLLGLACNTAFSLRVRQLCTDGRANSAVGQEVTASTINDGACLTPAGVPTALTASPLNPTSMNLAWTAGAPNDCVFQSYKVRVQHTDQHGTVGAWQEAAGCVSLSSRVDAQCTATGLRRGSYKFFVGELCEDSQTNSPISIASAGVVLPLIPALAPTNVRLWQPSTDGFIIDWTEPSELGHCTFKQWLVEIREAGVNGAPQGTWRPHPTGCQQLINMCASHCPVSGLWSNTDYEARVSVKCRETPASNRCQGQKGFAGYNCIPGYEKGPCRTESMGLGRVGIDYDPISASSPEACAAACDARADCLAFEAWQGSTHHCEIWKNVPPKSNFGDSREGLMCRLKDVGGPPSLPSYVGRTLPVVSAAPFSVMVSNLAATTAQITWVPGTLSIDCTFVSWDVQVQVETYTEWRTPEGCDVPSMATTTCEARNLLCGTTYRARVRAVCSPDGASSPFTTSENFATIRAGSCLVGSSGPVGVRASNPRFTTMEVSFSPGQGGDCVFSGFDVQRQAVGAATWEPAGGSCGQIVNREGPNCIARDLNPATSYLFRARELCSNGAALNSPWSLASTPVQTRTVRDITVQSTMPVGVVDVRPTDFTATFLPNVKFSASAGITSLLKICPQTSDALPNPCGCTGASCENLCVVLTVGSGTASVRLLGWNVLYGDFGSALQVISGCEYTVQMDAGFLETRATPSKASTAVSWAFTYSPEPPDLLDVDLVASTISTFRLAVSWSVPTRFVAKILGSSPLIVSSSMDYTGVSPVEVSFSGLTPSTSYNVEFEGSELTDSFNTATAQRGVFQTQDDTDSRLSQLLVYVSRQCCLACTPEAPVPAQLSPIFDAGRQGGATHTVYIDYSSFRTQCNIPDTDLAQPKYHLSVNATAQSPFATTMFTPDPPAIEVAVNWPANSAPVESANGQMTVEVRPYTGGSSRASTYTIKAKLLSSRIFDQVIRGASSPLPTDGSGSVEIDLYTEPGVDTSVFSIAFGPFPQSAQITGTRDDVINGATRTVTTFSIPTPAGVGINLPVVVNAAPLEYELPLQVSFASPTITSVSTLVNGVISSYASSIQDTLLVVQGTGLAPFGSGSSPTPAPGTVSFGYSLIDEGTCNGVDFTVDELEASYASLPAEYGGTPWYSDGSGYGTATCNIRSVQTCAEICNAVAGCEAFSTSTTRTCYACFLYKRCPATRTTWGYSSYALTTAHPARVYVVRVTEDCLDVACQESTGQILWDLGNQNLCGDTTAISHTRLECTLRPSVEDPVATLVMVRDGSTGLWKVGAVADMYVDGQTVSYQDPTVGGVDNPDQGLEGGSFFVVDGSGYPPSEVNGGYTQIWAYPDGGSDPFAGFRRLGLRASPATTGAGRRLQVAVPSGTNGTNQTNVTMQALCSYARVLSDTQIECQRSHDWPGTLGTHPKILVQTGPQKFSPQPLTNAIRIPQMEISAITTTSPYEVGSMEIEIRGANFGSQRNGPLEVRFISDGSATRAVGDGGGRLNPDPSLHSTAPCQVVTRTSTHVRCTLSGIIFGAPLADSEYAYGVGAEELGDLKSYPVVAHVKFEGTNNSNNSATGQDLEASFSFTVKLYQCSPGKHRVSSATQGCVDCAPGRFKNETGSALGCQPCPVGSFVAFGGQGSCQMCEPGYSTTAVGASSSSNCSCAPGFFRNPMDSSPGPHGTGICLPCPAGAVCEGGGVPPYSQSGFWTPDRMRFWSCHPASACLLANGLEPNRCDPTREPGSRRCAKCELGHYRYKGGCYTCEVSDRIKAWAGPILLLMLLWLVIVPCNVRFLRPNRELTNEVVDGTVGKKHILHSIFGEGKSPTFLKRILHPDSSAQRIVVLAFNRMQLLWLLGLIPYAWPSILEVLHDFLSIFAFDIDVLRPACLTNPLAGFKEYITFSYLATWYVSWSAPYFIVLNILLGIAIINYIRRKDSHKYIPFFGAVAHVVSVQFLFSVMSHVVDNLFFANCIPCEDNSTCMKDYPLYKCGFDSGDKEWLAMAVTSLMSLILVVLPLLAAIIYSIYKSWAWQHGQGVGVDEHGRRPWYIFMSEFWVRDYRGYSEFYRRVAMDLRALVRRKAHGDTDLKKVWQNCRYVIEGEEWRYHETLLKGVLDRLSVLTEAELKGVPLESAWEPPTEHTTSQRSTKEDQVAASAAQIIIDLKTKSEKVNDHLTQEDLQASKQRWMMRFLIMLRRSDDLVRKTGDGMGTFTSGSLFWTYAWEYFLALQKIVLVSIIMFSPESLSQTVTAICLLFMMLMLVMAVSIKPYSWNFLNKLEMLMDILTVYSMFFLQLEWVTWLVIVTIGVNVVTVLPTLVRLLLPAYHENVDEEEADIIKAATASIGQYTAEAGATGGATANVGASMSAAAQATTATPSSTEMQAYSEVKADAKAELKKTMSLAAVTAVTRVQTSNARQGAAALAAAGRSDGGDCEEGTSPTQVDASPSSRFSDRTRERGAREMASAVMQGVSQPRVGVAHQDVI